MILETPHGFATDAAAPFAVKSVMRSLLLVLALATPALADSVSVISNGNPRVREGAVAISPADPRIVIAAAIAGTSTSNAEVRMFRSADGGASWTSMGPLVKELEGRPLLATWDPVLAFDRGGRAYLAVVAAPSEMRWTIAVFRSTDGGLTWTGVDAGSPAIPRNDKPWIAIDAGGDIHVAWHQLQAGASGLAYAVSEDAGVTYSTPRLFRTFGWPYVAAGPDRDVYLSYVNESGGFDVIASTDDGASFGSPATIPASFFTFPHQIVADRSSGPHRGHVYAFLPGFDGVYFSRSVDRGRTWTVSKKISSGVGGMMPSIDVDPSTGEVVLAWLERETSTQTRLFATRSLDGGATLETPRAVSEPFHASRPVGEYNQLVALNGVHIVVYADESGAFYAARLDSKGEPAPTLPARRRRAVRP
jgi:hypothetical protein